MQLLICINFVRIFIIFEAFEMSWLLEAHFNLRLALITQGLIIYPGILPKQKIKKTKHIDYFQMTQKF